ncbi:MAG: biotin--[acetyl-CoA-carboxylase] ligase [Bdellovibrionales bacterium]
MRFNIHKIEKTTSTNDDVKAAAEKGEAEGLVVWALTQTAGRGRQGRAWQSPKGNLYFSFLWRPPIPIRAWGNYSFVVALAIHEIVQEFLPKAKVELKWPNDVLVEGKKISGILLETGKDWLVVGVGVNVEHVPETPLYPTTSLAAEKAKLLPLDEILNKILKALGVWYERMNAEGFAPVRDAWFECARKGEMRVRLPAGGEMLGEFVDLDAEGNLILRLKDGTTRKISAGDVL